MNWYIGFMSNIIVSSKFEGVKIVQPLSFTSGYVPYTPRNSYTCAQGNIYKYSLQNIIDSL